ncbi:MAG: MogA/MoaB family molybdenum cofactor biosynthesis protein [Planctomycetes bacterium]|nr:MogA/MoaB family molybdenum cofactor biosynthesis protein [Planctomycetota bacterium]
MANPYESPSAEEHRANSSACVRCAVVTVSDTRTLEQDSSGQTMVELLEAEGHRVAERTIVPDEPAVLIELVQRFSQSPEIDAILFTGGTGIAARDQTVDAIASLLTKELPGYGELLRMLSYQEIGAAAMLSRALGGIVDQTVVLTMPGSTAAVRLAMQKLVLPELAHMVSLAGR